MVDKRPRRNLDPLSEPWGRSVDDTLTQLEQEAVRLAQSNANAFKSMNSTMNVISQQIADLSEITSAIATQQEILNAQNATLAAQNATLSAQQGQLAATVNQINAVSANQVTGATASNSTGSPITVGNGGNYVGASVIVPGGYSRAVVMGTASIRIVGGANMALTLSVNINGNVGTGFPVFGDSGSSVTTAATAGHAATLTGLSGGQTITVWGRTTSVSSVSGAYFSNTASFIFLK
jgi:uncharacterized coiled-coil protein SlyX